MSIALPRPHDHEVILFQYMKDFKHGTNANYTLRKCRCVPCREAHTTTQIAWRTANSERAREYVRHYERIRSRNARADALAIYGNVCACCNESVTDFLCIDHINGDGNIHRKSIGRNIYKWLKSEKYPSGFQVLCHNCNWAKHLHGECPYHKD